MEYQILRRYNLVISVEKLLSIDFASLLFS